MVELDAVREDIGEEAKHRHMKNVQTDLFHRITSFFGL